jgi:predicted metalloprotease with PDZ domain
MNRHRGKLFRRLRASVLVSIAAFCFCARPASATIRYEISLAHVDTHEFDVTMVVPRNGHSSPTVAMPAWNALYQIRDFAYRVRDVKAAAYEKGFATHLRPISTLPIDKDTWNLELSSNAAAQPDIAGFTVTYSVEWNDPGPFDSQLDEHHAFLNLAEVLMYAPNRRSEPVEVRFDDVPADWKLIAELRPGPEPDSFIAPNYDALVDEPVEAGKFGEFDFDEDGAHFRVALDGKGYNQRRLEDYLQRITKYEMQLMGGPPFREYTFLLRLGSFSEVGGGGMEHADSTAISVHSWDGLKDLCAHEFFHAWNVKRIRPQAFEPIDYAKEQYTRVLWFAEGVTSAYASYALVRTGLWSKAEFYNDLASQITDLESRPARKWQSVEDSSLDTWLDKYPAYNDPDRSISYYGKGQILGVLLDLVIRDATNNRRSLDDVMRLMNDEYAQKGKFYNGDAAIQAAVEQVAGANFGNFFRNYIAGVNEIPYDKFFAIAGLELNQGGTGDNTVYSIVEMPQATERQLRIREGVLRGTTDR